MRLRAAVVAALAVGGLAISCSDDGDNEAGGAARTTTSSSTTSTTSGTTTEATGSTAAPPTTAPTTTRPPTSTTAPRDFGAAAVRLTEVARVTQPIAMTWCRGRTSVYIAERTGRVRVMRDGRVAGAPVLDLSSSVVAGGEQGLLGLACAPDGGWLYTSYTNREGDSRLVAYRLGPDDGTIDPSTARELLAVDQPAANHNGGNILFGPDGALWFGLGDGGGSYDRYGNAQNLDSLLGDILRIVPTPGGPEPYTIPAGNPYAGGGGRPEIAISGVRNPWRFTFDRATGDLWIGDVGQNALEEIDLLRAGRILGANLGWPRFEGTRQVTDTPAPNAIGPVFEYRIGKGRAVIGGYVYRGDSGPNLAGAYLFSDAYDPRLRALALHSDGRVEERELATIPGGSVSSFAEGPSGELYVLSLSGGIYRIDPA